NQPLQTRVGEHLAPGAFGHPGRMAGGGGLSGGVPLRGQRRVGALVTGNERTSAHSQGQRGDRGDPQGAAAWARKVFHGHASLASSRAMCAGLASGEGSSPLAPPSHILTTTKKTGTNKTANTVAAIMPAITAVPMARWAAEPGPCAVARGST